MGDHILCNGLYRDIKSRSRFLFIPVKNSYRKQVKRMLEDTSGILVLPLAENYYWRWMRLYQLFALLTGIRLISIGSFGSNFFRAGERFDANFYFQAKVDFQRRWSAKPAVNEETESSLFRELNCDEQPYIFLHEDVRRGYTIDRDLIGNTYKVIEPDTKLAKRYTIFDYKKVIENAVEIHCIESSFAAFVESLVLPEIPKYAHRYARGHAAYDFRHEFTYKANWKVLN